MLLNAPLEVPEDFPMSEPARQAPSPEPGLRTPAATAPLRDWLATMRTAMSDTPAVETRSAEPAPAEPDAEARNSGWSPRLVSVAAKSAEAADEDVAEIMAENMMLKARLRLESERRDELQVILAQEIRELRAHIAEEVGKMDDLRTERDLWRARCEALAAPLFQVQHR
ncbi:hypothetical protein [Methylorubrum extorquens]|jgi:hypothetical protein|uniref:hypothetical protein n=1 Tax=Methylorubrum extorquens TaxID=408 RepID=UPI0002D50A93|nr:hypothetical protein [Methylorubrum extorquens]KQP91468.1 hypothetical protein ASF55_02540 [Methylobacterium sp. Leaf119]MCG5249094.1 hypothetical protein [Methylorubrum extorquens]UYW26858.1 hypothetical protein OKC48_27140 [Methylorubrum extorquens]UYW33274.1 hypothetical protein OKB92_04035 [Methylorubrum extorquens]WIU40414.1 hypothetical protein KQ926_03430 [Methylorubrum extorquens]